MKEDIVLAFTRKDFTFSWLPRLPFDTYIYISNFIEQFSINMQILENKYSKECDNRYSNQQYFCPNAHKTHLTANELKD